MPHYKAPNDPQPHWLDDESFAHLLPEGSVKISNEEADAMRTANAQAPTAEKVRAERDAKLAACDWTQLPDAPLTTTQKENWMAYRQALRDITAQPGFPEAVEWPAEPA